MARIQLLPDYLIAQIAAGEVIERPSFAVKELIENSIDAHSSRIEIQIENAGLKKIQVIDDGDGMERQDLELSYLAHTTSKLIDELGLHNITTLGFRGEALSSIAAIATLTIQSRPKTSPTGIKIRIQNKESQEITPIGIPVGTTVIVENMYQSHPARKKFLKSEKTEFRHIADFVMQFALAYPSIHFLLRHNGKIIFDIPPRDSVTDRIKTLLGVTLFDQLIPLSYDEGYLHIEGMIGVPQVATKNNQKQFIFVNKRLVTDRIVQQAAKEAYGTLLSSHGTPIILLSITLPNEMLDVNIHPRKEQIAFINPQIVFTGIKQAISDALQTHNITFSLAKFKNDLSVKRGETQSYAGQLLKSSVNNSLLTENPSNTKSLFQYATTYIISSDEEGLLITDQHAAHERIIYEDLLAELEKKKNEKTIYILPRPVTIELLPTEKDLLEEYLDVFHTLHFGIDLYPGNTLVIREVPIIFKGRKIEKIIKDMLSDLETGLSITTIDHHTKRMLAFLACRSSVMAGENMTISSMKQLLKKLSTTPNKTTCPHGRPTQIRIGLPELTHAFKRSKMI